LSSGFELEPDAASPKAQGCNKFVETAG